MSRHSKPWEEYMERYEKYYWSPGKPSKEEGRMYYDYIKRSLEQNPEAKRALVLGATPMLRDELAKFELEVTCLDLSKEILEIMTKLTVHNKKELLVRGNWLDMPFEDNYFDMVLGDCTISNVELEHKNKFLKEINRVLNPNGFLIHRTWVAPDNWTFIPMDEVLKKFENIRTDVNISTEILMYPLNNTYDEKTMIMDMSKVKESLTPYFKNGAYHYPDKIVEKMLNDLHIMFQPYEKIWSTSTKDVVISWIEKEFEVLETSFASDHTFAKEFFFTYCKPKK